MAYRSTTSWLTRLSSATKTRSFEPGSFPAEAVPSAANCSLESFVEDEDGAAAKKGWLKPTSRGWASFSNPPFGLASPGILGVDARFPSALPDTLAGLECISELLVDGARERVYFNGIFIVKVEPVVVPTASLLTRDILPPIKLASWEQMDYEKNVSSVTLNGVFFLVVRKRQGRFKGVELGRRSKIGELTSPRPVPPYFLLRPRSPWTNGSNTLSLRCSGMPGPVSSTSNWKM
jgi:hypothetical protein